MLAASSNTANSSNHSNNSSSYFDATHTSPSGHGLTTGSTRCPSLTSSSTTTTTSSSSSSSGNPSPSSLPPTYATLPRTTKLEEEPNPFEQSFSKPVLPPVSSIESPGIRTTAMWDSLRAGPLSPSMLLGPAGAAMNKRSSISTTTTNTTAASTFNSSISGFVKCNNETAAVNRARYQQSPSVKRSLTEPMPDMLGNDDDEEEEQQQQLLRPAVKRRAQSSSSMMDDQEKRKSFLERNRQAALKCRQRKKQWLQNLQAKVEYLSSDNEQLQMQNNSLREQLIELKSMLLAHKTCPVNPEAVIDAVNRPIPGTHNHRHHSSSSSLQLRHNPQHQQRSPYQHHRNSPSRDYPHRQHSPSDTTLPSRYPPTSYYSSHD
ncbi:hypothetical protein BDB00DRAFT_967925 [Zychaea mexicana]|uniref:uncharacterized protein n=1 Tax=Zychaea mexicana TaxID=64656 RepID=UPI0022FE01ED|nr:uncharacterized protein BDB00DRAFT_967925 [Zychaea mexicana]KAI9498887.1 hypothetical protein BDB00DRAFT_967925 [Zychaea mexicana]